MPTWLREVRNRIPADQGCCLDVFLLLPRGEERKQISISYRSPTDITMIAHTDLSRWNSVPAKVVVRVDADLRQQELDV